MTIVSEFISRVQAIYATGNATEHSYRSAFEQLFTGLGVTALNEPKRVACGAPDFIVSNGDIVIGHLEAKDLHVPIQGMKDNNKTQQERYLAALPNLIYSNGLDWDFYRDGDLLASVSIGHLGTKVAPTPDQFSRLENLLRNFIAQRPQTITSPKELAERMAGKASLIKDVLRNTLREDEDFQSELAGQYKAFKENLIHDITPEDFADIYAETIAYGMFAARLHDTSLDTFTRQEALELLPKSNPFLRALFGYIAGHDLDDRIAWIIDDLARVFQACDVARIMQGFGKLTGQNDPFLHFYETFLAAYNPAKRKARGVWYTPEPVVNFIVRAVDEVLQTEFGLPDGLADTSKVTIDWDTGQTDKKGKPIAIRKEVHRVQILDPATGTGTFLAEVIKQIAPKVKGVAPGMWSQYIETDLIPRLHGFELLMASYAMCHMKLDMILTELGYKPSGTPPRLSVYLTNSLEEGEPANMTLPFTQWLSREAKGANTIKRDMPIMCVIGNPPYSGISQNMGDWISDLIDNYKYINGKHFGERKHWLNDDYVKFIRLSEKLIEKNGEGILGFITNHGYLTNPTFRGMRHHLLKTFDGIRIINLHGNAAYELLSQSGQVDRNVFDIRVGVCIIIAWKKTNSKDFSNVSYADVIGPREFKNSVLQDSKFQNFTPITITPKSEYYFFRDFDHTKVEAYYHGNSLEDIFIKYSSGSISAKDRINYSFSKEEAQEKIVFLINSSDSDIRKKFGLNSKDARDWTVPTAKLDANKHFGKTALTQNLYRPFDTRWTLYTGQSRGLYASPQSDIASHIRGANAPALIATKVNRGRSAGYVLCTSSVFDFHIFDTIGDSSSAFPLYLYPNEQELDQSRRVNFDRKFFARMQKLAKHAERGTPDEVEVFDYIYGALHCPAYRETYAEFLKIDFPRIPWPTSPDEFWDVSAKGSVLRKLHLMDLVAIGPTPYLFPIPGNGVVDKPRFEEGKVWINDTQYFDNAPEASWGFYIGGYQPAQKWLKDRKGRSLSFEDVKHYQRILKILSETDRIMKTINMTLDANVSEG
ncbi:adenine-specific DNA methyltransferase [Oceanibaculum indicum P24]|uniref:site-specific DNA-methyltransferase (adenine-specific) n=2 Tax=Oceanibaculum indicum TaxID=526216 RepID=K2IXB8_9PROT|nr:adenine-specific DNA methyltransferase [Oceanibaculum indicum P24]